MSVTEFYRRNHLTSSFGDGRNGGRKHRGVDFSHSRTPGTTDIPALLAGKVVGKRAPSSAHGFGHQVTIESTWGGRTVRFSYAHLHTASKLKVGDKVSQGQIVGREGRTGWTTGNCVHIELFVNGGYINPAPTIESIRASAGAATGGVPEGYSAVTAAVQNAMNVWFKAGLDVDGILGDKTTTAIKNAQVFLQKKGLYKGKIDGRWGPLTNTALNRHRDQVKAAAASKPAPKPSPKAHNPFGIPSAKGLQKIAKLYGYKGKIDDQFGAGSRAGFAEFLRKNYGYRGNDILGKYMWAAIARWLRARWGYKGNDQPGPNMRAALKRANDANFKEL